MKGILVFWPILLAATLPPYYTIFAFILRCLRTVVKGGSSLKYNKGRNQRYSFQICTIWFGYVLLTDFLILSLQSLSPGYQLIYQHANLWHLKLCVQSPTHQNTEVSYIFFRFKNLSVTSVVEFWGRESTGALF